MADQGIVLNITPLLPKRVMGNPFGTTGYSWCPRCRMGVDGHHETYVEELDVESCNRGGRYVFKSTCRRCGKVLAFGGFEEQDVHVGGPSRYLEMREWCTTPTRDRR
jgi:hypothetical protein